LSLKAMKGTAPAAAMASMLARLEYAASAETSFGTAVY